MKSKVTNRINFLHKEFKIFNKDDIEQLILVDENDSLLNIHTIDDSNSETLIIIRTNLIDKSKNKYKIDIHISNDVFTKVIDSDPTNNKEFIQWMLTILRNMVKNETITDDNIKRYVQEDLNLANTYLDLFRKNKNKRKFTELAKFIPNSVKDPTNINQYTSLSQLFDVVDPFIERKPSTLERAMVRFVDSGMANIPFKDRKWTVYQPLTVDANCVMNNFASWCTALPGNGNFKTYTENYLKPNKEKSSIYIIINNDLFKGETDECYQIHFESNQIKGRDNSHNNINLYEKVLSTSENISNFFKHELISLSKQSTNVLHNKYVDYLIKFGFSDFIFEVIDELTPIIMIDGTIIKKLPDISRFINLDELILINTKTEDLGNSIGLLSNLELLSLPNNNIKILPKELGNLKKLQLINLKGNKIEETHNNIRFLDKTNGGSLYRISINEQDISIDNLNKLRKLLPTTIISG